MSDLINNIFLIKKSKSYIDYKNYHKGNIFGITKMSRRELMHSNFIAWALSPNSSHSLGFYPLYLFVRSLNLIKDSVGNESARTIPTDLLYQFYDDNFIISATINREYAIKVGRTNKYIDLLIEIETKDKILPILIENKVESKENGANSDQTKVYFDWCEKDPISKFQDKSKYFDVIYIYLYPEYNTKMQQNKSYIRMTYQNLVDYVLEPSMVKCGDTISKNNYNTYLQCLSFQTDNEKGEYTMAISNEERKILNDFIAENRDLLCAVLNGMDDVDSTALTSITSSLKDHSQYQFMEKPEGNPYGKGKLVLAVVQYYVADKKPKNFQDLQNAFPDKLRNGHRVVELSVKVSDKAKGIGGRKRYYIEPSEIIKLPSGEEVLVSSQWGGVETIENFIQYVTANFGYTITKI